MTRKIVRRLLTLIPLVWLVLTLTFIVVQLAPGSYADTIDHPRLSADAREAIRGIYGLDQPATVQYFKWLGATMTGDLGTSFLFKEPVARVIGRALPPTVLLAGTALLIDLVLGLLIAVTATRRPYSVSAYTVCRPSGWREC